MIKKGYIPTVGYSGGNPIWYGYGGAVEYTINEYLTLQYSISKVNKKLLEYTFNPRQIRFTFTLFSSLAYSYTYKITNKYKFVTGAYVYKFYTDALYYSFPKGVLPFLIDTKPITSDFFIGKSVLGFQIDTEAHFDFALLAVKKLNITNELLKLEVKR